MKMNYFKNRRFKHGSLATVIVALFIVAVVIVNIITTLLLDRFPLTIDLTKESRFSMTQDSVDFVKKIDRDVKIIVCASEGEFKSAGELFVPYQIIKGYEKHNKKIEVEFVNLAKDPSFSAKYPKEQLATGDIIVQSDLRMTKFPYTVLYNVNQGETGTGTYSSEAEQKMTSALMYVTDNNPSTVSILAGNGNVSVAGYASLLQANNYNVITQNITTDEINADADFIVLPTPQTDLSTDQVKKIADFLDNDGKFGKSLVYIASPSYAVGPVLKTFLADWGLEVTEEYVMETDQSKMFNDQWGIIPKVTDEEIQKQIKVKEQYIVAPTTKAIKLLFAENDNRKTSSICTTFDTAVLVTQDKDGKPVVSETGEYNIVAKGTRTKIVDNKSLDSNVIAFGTETIMDPSYLTFATVNNADLVIAITNNIVERDNDLKIIPVTITNETMSATAGQIKVLNFIFVVGIPLAFIAALIVVWSRRRNL